MGEEAEPDQDHEELETGNIVFAESKTSVDRELEELNARLPPIDRAILPRWRRNNAHEVCFIHFMLPTVPLENTFLTFEFNLG